jgi:hypothetical protein
MYLVVGLIIGGALLWMVARGVDGVLDFLGLTVFEPPKGLNPFERGPRPDPPGFPVLPPLATPVERRAVTAAVPEAARPADSEGGEPWTN